MKRKRIWIAILSALCCLLLAFPAMATKSGLEDAKKKKTALQEEKSRAEAALRELESLKGAAAAYVKKLDASLETLSDELSRLDSDIKAKEAEIEMTKSELAEAEQTEKEQYESMKLRIKYMYEKGESTYVDLLMQSKSLSELLNRAEYIGKITEYDREKMDEYMEIESAAYSRYANAL